MASVAQAWPLIGPVAVGAEDWPEPSVSAQHQADPSAASTSTTIGQEVEFWLKNTDGVLLLCTNRLETLDPYGGDPIKSFSEVICAHEFLLLLHLDAAHANFPTDYLVYGCNLRGGHGPWVHRLPVIKQPTRSRSMGLRRTDDDGYVVANLRQELDREKQLPPKTYLDCFYYSPSSKLQIDGGWITREVEFLGVENLLTIQQAEDGCSAEEILFGWRTDRVIPFDDDTHKAALMWVDFSRGILLCDDLILSKDAGPAGKIKLRFVPHPPDLFPKGDLRWEHPHPYCSVGCSNGKLKLISLPSVQNAAAAACEVLAWTLDWGDLKWNRDQKSTRLEYKRLLENSKVESLPELSELADNSPCYPLLSTAKSNILYLTLVVQSKAWLLQINMRTCSLDAVADYPSFFDNMNPPYPCDLSKYLNEDEVVTKIKGHEDGMDRQSHPTHLRQAFKKIGHKFKNWNPFICIVS